MDRRSWLWRRKSSEKSLGETESSGSISSYSERYSDDQEVLRASPNNDSPSHSQSPEVSSSTTGGEVHVTVKSLSEKLSAALLAISAKEDLVKQHMKVAEEAVSGWEKAETELVALKQQLEAAIQKNSSLEDRIGHLDGALKESVRQNRQSREEQEQKIHDVLLKKTREWESDKFEFENRITKLQIQLESAKSEASTSINYGLQSKLEAAEKENTALKAELFARTEDLRIRTLEKELSTRAAESASKQHLESIKKVAKLEGECRRLRAVPRKPISNSVCVESLTDSQSDCGEPLLSVDNEPSCSDSWASALIAELDQFKIEKASERNLASSSIDIDLMDDFLEMERLVAMPDAGHGSSSFKPEAETNNAHRKMAELEEKVAKAENVKAELEMVLVDSRNQLLVAEDRLVVLQRHLDSANESKLAAGEKMKALESQLEFARLEDRKLREKVYILQCQAEKEKTVSKEFAAKLESAEATIRALECELESAHFEVNELNEKVGVLESKVQEEKSISVEFETKRKVTQCQFESARLEIDKLHEKAILLEVNLEAAEAAREALETDLKLAHLEVGELHDKMGLFENKIKEEKVLSAKLAARCQSLEGDLPWRKQEADVQIITSSNGEQKIKQEKELAISAGKLAECQKIIASLSRQLKSLSSLDDFMLEIEKTT